MTGGAQQRLQIFVLSASSSDARLAPQITTCAWHKRLYIQTCNRNAPLQVIDNGVDALLTTWMILMQARWFRLRSSMTMTQLARWCGTFIRWLQKSSGRTVRAERPRRTFAK